MSTDSSMSGSASGSASGSVSGSGFGTLEYDLPLKPSTLEQAVNDIVNNHLSQRSVGSPPQSVTEGSGKC